MNRIGKISAGVALAVVMAYIAPAPAASPAPVKGGKLAKGNVQFYLADPELGLAGVYTANGTELYFEARRQLDAASGLPGELSVRVIDAEARTLALGGESYARHWVPQQGEFVSSDGFAYAQLLTGLGQALGAADLHVALSAEKMALADLAAQASATPAARFPARLTTLSRTSFAPTAMQTADFYQRAGKNLQVVRQPDGMLEASLGKGIVFMSAQKYIADEPDVDTGQMGRIDAYSMVKAADGYVLGSELGGDAMPDGWEDALTVENARDHHSLATDFGGAATALNALAYSGRSARGVALSNPMELAAMHRLAQTLTSHLLPVRDEGRQMSILGRTDNEAAAAGLYQTYIQVWRKPFVVLAEHSGTRVGKWKYKSSTSSVKTHQGWTAFCNHGTCAGGAKMTHKCSYTGPRLSYYRTPVRYSGSGGHTCSTGYFATAMWNRHNCHDDSSTQVKAIRGQSYSLTGGRCGDFPFSMYAPSCGVQ